MPMKEIYIVVWARMDVPVMNVRIERERERERERESIVNVFSTYDTLVNSSTKDRRTNERKGARTDT